MTKSKTFRFTESMGNDLKWLAEEFNTTETEMIKFLITYAACRHSNYIEGDSNPDIEKYMKFEFRGH